MKTQRNLAATGSNRHKLVYSVLVTLFCLAMPVATVYAVTPDATGVVTCKESYQDGTSANVQYPVQFYWDGTVVGRWGSGKDVKYRSRVVPVGDRNFTLYPYSLSDPDNPDTFEMLYSETGMLDLRVNKNNQAHITGKSFVVMDFHWMPPASTDWLYLSAQCTWNLTGYMPGG